MNTTVTLDERRYKAALEKARELGKSPDSYIESLIDAATMNLDDILAPVREGVSQRGLSEEELDDVVTKARKAIREEPGTARRND
jgi:hypothetical protein